MYLPSRCANAERKKRIFFYKKEILGKNGKRRLLEKGNQFQVCPILRSSYSKSDDFVHLILFFYCQNTWVQDANDFYQRVVQDIGWPQYSHPFVNSHALMNPLTLALLAYP